MSYRARTNLLFCLALLSMLAAPTGALAHGGHVRPDADRHSGRRPL